MIRLDSRTRYAAFILILALLASLAVAAFRFRTESHANRVELAMDFGDFISVARSYNYNPAAFLIALRRAGLTSIALSEELGGSIGGNGLAYATTGAALLNQSRLSPLSDPLLQGLARTNKLSRDAIYLIVYDRATFDRYRRQLPLHFEAKTIRVLRSSSPWIIEVRTQVDYFNSVGLGIPDDQLALAKRLNLLVVARFQNDERFTKSQMEAEFNDALASGARISGVVFFGLGNEVFGYPDHLPDAAAAFREHFEGSAHPFNFGSIETYDPTTIQKGNDTLARLIPGQTVRLQAVVRGDYDKIKLDELIGRFVLGVRERNIRIVYLRPWTHQEGGLSIEATNVKMVKDLAGELRSHGLRLGRATPVPGYRGNSAILVGVATLAVPSIFVLLLGWFGWYRPSWAIAAYAVTILLYLAGVVSHHEMFARSVIALAGALLFAAAAFGVIAPAFYEEPAPRFGDQIVRSLGWTVLATVVALLGAIVVVGIMSSPLTMEEIERFRGVRALYVLTPLIALCMYLFSKRYNTETTPRQIFGAPITLYQLIVGIVVIAAGALLVMRSGNTSDVQPSSFELAMRHVLSNVLSVRPRTKEFLIGAPLLMLAPALLSQHRRAVGWLLALGIGVGIGDVIDTFSHLHTPVIISLQRIGNGVIIGAIVGILAIWIYRRACTAFGLLRVR